MAAWKRYKSKSSCPDLSRYGRTCKKIQKDFAVALTYAGFLVFANDHRGHGKTAVSFDDIGYLGDKNG